MVKYYVLMAALLMSVAPAAITFVDADLTNTTVNGTALNDGVNYADGSNSITDNLWGTRSRSSVNGGYIWTTDAPADGTYLEATEPLVTTMTVAAQAGQYRIFGLFYISQQGTSLWDCTFSLDGKTYLYFNKDNAIQAQTSFFEDAVLVQDVNGTGYLFVVQLGIVTTTAENQQISIYVQGLDMGETDTRTWFEGIGYQDAGETVLVPVTEPVVIPEEPDILPTSLDEVTLNKKDTGFRGIWYYSNYLDEPGIYNYHYAGGLGTYCTRHRPMAIYRPEADKTFFCYGGTSAASNRRLWHMAAEYDHATGQVSMPTVVVDKRTGDAHDNPTMSVDGDGYVWIFSTSHGTGPISYIHKSKQPYNIDEFELVESTKIDAGGNVVPFTNFSYFQPWNDGAHGFSAFLTIYDDPVKRTTQFMKTTDGINWSQPQKICIAGRGAYQISGQYGNKLVAAFNYHPDGEYDKAGVLWRTNLYCVQTLDNGQTWQTVDGTPVTLPLETPDILTTPMLVRNGMTPTWRNIYLTDIRFDSAGNPIILHLTAAAGYPGPESDPRYLEIAHWNGSEWIFSTVAPVDHNYDGGSLYIEDGGATWRIIGTFEPGPQPYATGGEVSQYVSTDQGLTWTKVMDMTSGSTMNHNHVRRPLNADPDFYGFWADGNSYEMSESNIYYCDKAGNVTKLPRGTGPAADDCDYLVPEDINHDCRVNLTDFAAFAENWQTAGGRIPVEFPEPVECDPVSDSFEAAAINELPYTLASGAAPVFSSVSHTGDQSVFWAEDVTGVYEFLPFDGSSFSNTVVSTHVYLPSSTGAGRSYISVMDAESNPVMLILDRDGAGVYDIIYRIDGVYTRAIEDVSAGWHQFAFVIHADNAVGVYFDDQYLATATNFTTGLNKIKFGKPWSNLDGIGAYFDDLTVKCETDTIGGGSSQFGDVFEDFEYTGIDGFAQIGGYVYEGAPTLTNVVTRSATQAICTANDNSTIIKKKLPSTQFNCRLSAWVYVPRSNSGRAYLKAISEDDRYAFVGLVPDPDRVYYRHETNSYEGFNVSKGWHLMSIIVDYQGHFHMFFDNHFLGEHTTTTGLTEIDFGNPWSSPGYAVFDAMTLVHDIRGGFMGDWNTIYQPGDLNQDGINNSNDLHSLSEQWLVDPVSYTPTKAAPAVYLTFDDRFVSQWVDAMPIFDQYGVKATFCVTYFDTLSPEQLAGLHTLQSAGHAIACHGLRHRKAVDYVNENSLEAYWLDEVKPALDLMRAEGFNPACFAYPYSQNDDRTDQLLLRHFSHLRSGLPITETNRILNDPSKIEAGCGFYGTAMDSNRISISEIYALMDEAKARNASIVFYGHNIAETFDGHYTTPQRLHDMISYAMSIGLEFKAFK